MKKLYLSIILAVILVTSFLVPQASDSGIVADFSTQVGFDSFLVEFSKAPQNKYKAIVDKHSNYQYVEGFTRFTLKEVGDGYISVPIYFDLDEYDYIVIKYRVSGEIKPTRHIYSKTQADDSYRGDAGKWKQNNLITDNQWHIRTLQASVDFPAQTGRVTGLRLPMPTDVGEYFDIEYVGAFKSIEDAQAYEAARGERSLNVHFYAITHASQLEITVSSAKNGDWLSLVTKDGLASTEYALAYKYLQAGSNTLAFPGDKDGGLLNSYFTAGEYDLVLSDSDGHELLRETVSVKLTDLLPSEVYWDFRLSKTLEAIHNEKRIGYEFDSSVKALNLTFSDGSNTNVNDPYLYLSKDSNTNASLEKYKVVSLYVKRSKNSPLSGQLYFTTYESGSVSSDKYKRIDYTNTEEWQLVTVDMSDVPSWKNYLQLLRFDPFGACKTNDSIAVKYIGIFESLDAATEFNGNFVGNNLVTVNGGENGLVTGGGLYKANEAFELRAKALPNFAFGGFYNDDTGQVISVQEHYSALADDNISISARFFDISNKDDIVFETLGAQIRRKEPQGLRFVTQINKKTIPLDATDVSYGTLVTLERNLLDNSLDYDALEIGASGFKYLDVVGERIFVKDEDYNWFTAVIINIPESEQGTNFLARSYVTYKDSEGNLRTVYDKGIVRSVNMVKEGLGIDVFDEENIILTFGAMSDTHLGADGQEEKINSALGILKARASNGIDAFLFAGDVTDTAGRTNTNDQILLFKNAVLNHIGEDISVVYCLGVNHDHYSSTEAYTDADIALQREMFRDTLGPRFYLNEVTPSEDFNKGMNHYIIKGFHFLALDYDSNRFNQEKIQWFDNTLAAITEAEPNKPVFVTYHVPNHSELSDIIDKYPQVVLFTGHNHRPINNDLAIMQDNYTHLHGGGMFYYRQRDEQFNDMLNLGDVYEFAQGYLIEVDVNNNIRIRRQDFNNNEEYSPVWYISSPKEDRSHLRYTRDKIMPIGPSFDSSTITITSESESFVAGKFDSATKGSNPVEHYLLTIYQLVDDKIVKSQQYISSQLAIRASYDQLAELEFSFDRLGTDYALTLTAYDCYMNSETIYFNSGLNAVLVESIGQVYINGLPTNVAFHQTDDIVLVEIIPPKGYEYLLESDQASLTHDSFVMPNLDVEIRVILVS